MAHPTPGTQPEQVKLIFWAAKHRAHPKGEMERLAEEQDRDLAEIEQRTGTGYPPLEMSEEEYYASMAEAYADEHGDVNPIVRVERSSAEQEPFHTVEWEWSRKTPPANDVADWPDNDRVSYLASCAAWDQRMNGQCE